ncbi:MAG TPA: ABC transporter permease subunit [Symbiobacteriaceae bacterium]|nr:ABC transporter permease subunit [Symbiobacteriaceae bacterium]
MNKQAMWAIAKKDMSGIRSNVQVWMPMLVVPLIMGVILPGVTIGLLSFLGLKSSDMQELLTWMQRLPLDVIAPAANSLATLEQKVAYMVANYMFAPFFVLIPLMTASVISADSFAGEKERGTLETLLFAPVDLMSLFLGKLLASFIPTVLLTLGTFGLCAVTVNGLGWKLFHGLFFPTWNWLVLMVLVIPLIAIAAMLFNVFISAKVATFQAAYQLGGLTIIPFLLLLGGQISGILLLGTTVLLILAAVLAIIDVLLLQLLIKRLGRSALFESQVR